MKGKGVNKSRVIEISKIKKEHQLDILNLSY